jgi:Ca2+-binding RTX toxin-like protein
MNFLTTHEGAKIMVTEKRDPKTGRIVVEGGDEADYIQVHDYDSDEDGTADGITVEAYDAEGNQTFGQNYTAAEASRMSIKGGAGDDVIEVDRDVQYGLNLEGGKGNDSIVGGAGNDRIFGGEGNDRIFGGEGDDRLLGGEGDDVMYGGAGNDQMWGGPGNDRMAGQAGDDEMYGGFGNDSMRGGFGNDTLHGQEGQDDLKDNLGTNDVNQ